MDYEKKYKKAVNKIRNLLDDGEKNGFTIVTYKTDLESIFPELCESEDERIRKALICGMYALKEQHKTCFASIPIDNAIAWLEKQGEPNPYSGTSFEYNGHTWGMCARDNGVDILLDKQLFKHLEKQDEQKQEINNFDVLPGLYKCVHRMFDGTPDGRLLFEVGNVYRCLSKHDRAEFEVSYGHSVYLEDPVVCKHFIPFEKQGEQKPIIDGILTATNYDKMFQNCNVPKFNVGDWVVYYRNDSSREVIQVYDIRDGRYYFTDNVHFSWSVKECDERCHLWTIEDARDGDVIACENGRIGIFKCLNDNLFSSYCFIDNEGWFFGDEGQVHMLDTIICGEIYPATKEQHDLLFSKMRKAGYEWNSNKKELKKIDARENLTLDGDLMEADCMIVEQKSWSEEDEKMLADACIMLDWYHGNNWWTARRIKDWLKSLKQRIGE